MKDLASSIAFLLCLLSGQRCQTIQYLNVEHMDVTENEYIFHIVEKLKHTCPGVHQKPLRFIKYESEPRLCIYRHLKEYLERTSLFRADQKQLLISCVHPHSAVSWDTISRWCCKVLEKFGIDISKYSAHTTRAASMSSLARKNFDLKEVIIAAGLTQEQTFQRFYNLPLNTLFNFGHALLTADNSSV